MAETLGVPWAAGFPARASRSSSLSLDVLASQTEVSVRCGHASQDQSSVFITPRSSINHLDELADAEDDDSLFALTLLASSASIEQLAPALQAPRVPSGPSYGFGSGHQHQFRLYARQARGGEYLVQGDTPLLRPAHSAAALRAFLVSEGGPNSVASASCSSGGVERSGGAAQPSPRQPHGMNAEPVAEAGRQQPQQLAAQPPSQDASQRACGRPAVNRLTASAAAEALSASGEPCSAAAPPRNPSDAGAITDTVDADEQALTDGRASPGSESSTSDASTTPCTGTSLSITDAVPCTPRLSCGSSAPTPPGPSGSAYAPLPLATTAAASCGASATTAANAPAVSGPAPPPPLLRGQPAATQAAAAGATAAAAAQPQPGGVLSGLRKAASDVVAQLRALGSGNSRPTSRTGMGTGASTPTCAAAAAAAGPAASARSALAAKFTFAAGGGVSEPASPSAAAGAMLPACGSSAGHGARLSAPSTLTVPAEANEFQGSMGDGSSTWPSPWVVRPKPASCCNFRVHSGGRNGDSRANGGRSPPRSAETYDPRVYDGLFLDEHVDPAMDLLPDMWDLSQLSEVPEPGAAPLHLQPRHAARQSFHVTDLLAASSELPAPASQARAVGSATHMGIARTAPLGGSYPAGARRLSATALPLDLLSASGEPTLGGSAAHRAEQLYVLSELSRINQAQSHQQQRDGHAARGGGLSFSSSLPPGRDGAAAAGRRPALPFSGNAASGQLTSTATDAAYSCLSFSAPVMAARDAHSGGTPSGAQPVSHMNDKSISYDYGCLSSGQEGFDHSRCSAFVSEVSDGGAVGREQLMLWPLVMPTPVPAALPGGADALPCASGPFVLSVHVGCGCDAGSHGCGTQAACRAQAASTSAGTPPRDTSVTAMLSGMALARAPLPREGYGCHGLELSLPLLPSMQLVNVFTASGCGGVGPAANLLAVPPAMAAELHRMFADRVERYVRNVTQLTSGHACRRGAGAAAEGPASAERLGGLSPRVVADLEALRVASAAVPPWGMSPVVWSAAHAEWRTCMQPLLHDIQYLLLCVPNRFTHGLVEWDREMYCTTLARLLVQLERHELWQTLAVLLEYCTRQGVALLYQGEAVGAASLTAERLRALLVGALHDEISIKAVAEPAASAYASAAGGGVGGNSADLLAAGGQGSGRLQRQAQWVGGGSGMQGDGSSGATGRSRRASVAMPILAPNAADAATAFAVQAWRRRSVDVSVARGGAGKDPAAGAGGTAHGAAPESGRNLRTQASIGRVLTRVMTRLSGAEEQESSPRRGGGGGAAAAAAGAAPAAPAAGQRLGHLIESAAVVLAFAGVMLQTLL